MVRERGLEPPRPKAHAPKACVSTIPPLAHGETCELYPIRGGCGKPSIVLMAAFVHNCLLGSAQLRLCLASRRLRGYGRIPT